MTNELITDGQRLVNAKYGSGYTIQTYDDGFGPLWISRNSIGINGIVRAQTWEDAYSVCEDELFPEGEYTIEELENEYGSNWIENDCFNEAFGFRPNGPNQADVLGHGIYAKDLNGDYLERLTPELVEQIGITLTIEDWAEKQA